MLLILKNHLYKNDTESRNIWFLLSLVLLLFVCAFIYGNRYSPDNTADKKPILNVEITTPNYENNNASQLDIGKKKAGQINYSFISSALDAGISNLALQEIIEHSKDKFELLSSSTRSGWFAANTKSAHTSSFLYTDEEQEFFFYKVNDDLILDQFGEPYGSLSGLLTPTQKQYRITSHFAEARLHPVTNRVQPHRGTDYATPVGTEVLSVMPGKVIASRYDRVAGHYITIGHSNNMMTRYLHLSERNVRKGDFISKGDIIGKSGNSGRTTGPHLHFELHIAGEAVDAHAKHLLAFHNVDTEYRLKASKAYESLHAAIREKKLSGMALASQ
ncbi:M23 family metallopeptidase [Vibrio mexicanus]|uniref:M23 family metallopeptidase n=1 Tax=Vibrio mexicanus TaxID=1004326 RepID=UPI00069A62F1|nr:peptidoglycan DD-metalloendopeptidase family protein [Vibrio mexicanus]